MEINMLADESQVSAIQEELFDEYLQHGDLRPAMKYVIRKLPYTDVPYCIQPKELISTLCINEKELTVRIMCRVLPTLRVVSFMHPVDFQGKKKLKGLWQTRPVGWPEVVPHKDPNNNTTSDKNRGHGKGVALDGPKEKVNEIKMMFNFLRKKFLERMQRMVDALSDEELKQINLEHAQEQAQQKWKMRSLEKRPVQHKQTKVSVVNLMDNPASNCSYMTQTSTMSETVPQAVETYQTGALVPSGGGTSVTHHAQAYVLEQVQNFLPKCLQLIHINLGNNCIVEQLSEAYRITKELVEQGQLTQSLRVKHDFETVIDKALVAVITNQQLEDMLTKQIGEIKLQLEQSHLQLQQQAVLQSQPTESVYQPLHSGQAPSTSKAPSTNLNVGTKNQGNEQDILRPFSNTGLSILNEMRDVNIHDNGVPQTIQDRRESSECENVLNGVLDFEEHQHYMQSFGGGEMPQGQSDWSPVLHDVTFQATTKRTALGADDHIAPMQDCASVKFFQTGDQYPIPHVPP